MEARIKFRPETLHQTSTVGKILQFIQKHPDAARNTNCTLLAKRMNLAGEGNVSTLFNNITKMVRNQMLFRENSKHHTRFSINYLHKDLPAYILAGAPKETKELVKNTIEQGKALSKKIEKHKTARPVPIKKIETKPVAIPVRKKPIVKPIEVKRTPNGVTITINLNINL